MNYRIFSQVVALLNSGLSVTDIWYELIWKFSPVTFIDIYISISTRGKLNFRFFSHWRLVFDNFLKTLFFKFLSFFIYILVKVVRTAYLLVATHFKHPWLMTVYLTNRPLTHPSADSANWNSRFWVQDSNHWTTARLLLLIIYHYFDLLFFLYIVIISFAVG